MDKKITRSGNNVNSFIMIKVWLSFFDEVSRWDLWLQFLENIQNRIDENIVS